MLSRSRDQMLDFMLFLIPGCLRPLIDSLV
jgi:hypothetical protein